MTLWYFFNFGLLGLPSSATSDTPREGQRALEPRGRSGAVPAPTASTRPPIHPGPAGRRPWRSRSLQPFPQGVSHSSAGNPNKAAGSSRARHRSSPAQPSLAAAAGAWSSYSYMEQHSLGTSQLLLGCWLQKKSFIFLLPQISTKVLFYLSDVLFLQKRWRSGRSASPGPRLTVSVPKPCLGAGLI